MKLLIEKDPCQIVRRVVEGMLPNNTIRDILVGKNLIIHEGPFHDHFAQKLPQFVKQRPLDINEVTGLSSIRDKDAAQVIFESDPSNLPEEMAHLPRDIDNSLATPLPYATKTHKYSRKQQKLGIALRRSYRSLKKYREY